MGHTWVKNGFFQKCSWSIGDAQTSVFSPFSARVDAFWPMENPNMLEKGPLWDQKWVKKSEMSPF